MSKLPVVAKLPYLAKRAGLLRVFWSCPCRCDEGYRAVVHGAWLRGRGSCRTECICRKIDPIQPRFCQSDVASDDLRWAADRHERMNPYGNPLSVGCGASRALWRFQLNLEHRHALKAVFVVGMLLGGALIALGATLGGGLGRVSLTFGSAVLGTSVIPLIQAWVFGNTLLVPEASLAALLTPGITSGNGYKLSVLAPEDLEKLAVEFFVYHQTQEDDADGQSVLVWRCTVLDFRNASRIGHLTTRITTPNPEGNQVPYVASIGLLGSRLILLRWAVGSSEPVGVEIYPSWGDTSDHHKCGLKFLQTWSGNQAVSASIIRNAPIGVTQDSGVVSDAEADYLNKEWQAGIKARNEMLLCSCLG